MWQYLTFYYKLDVKWLHTPISHEIKTDALYCVAPGAAKIALTHQSMDSTRQQKVS